MNRIYFIGTFAGMVVMSSCNNHNNSDSSSNLTSDTTSSIQMVDTVMNKTSPPKVNTTQNESTGSNTDSADSLSADNNGNRKGKVHITTKGTGDTIIPF